MVPLSVRMGDGEEGHMQPSQNSNTQGTDDRPALTSGLSQGVIHLTGQHVLRDVGVPPSFPLQCVFRPRSPSCGAAS
jgi:hypothetical protein